MLEGLKLGSVGSYVGVLQLALLRAGFYAGEIDNIYGKMTDEAAAAFALSRGFYYNGSVTGEMQSALELYLMGYAEKTIESGDTFYFLALQYKSSVNAIRTANPQFDPRNLPVGEKVIIPYGYLISSAKINYTYYYTNLVIRGLKKQFPFIDITSIGNTVMGKPIECIRIGRGSRNLMYNGTHHANEWITTTLLLRFCEEYLRAISQGGSIFGFNANELYENTSLYIIPCVDADGMDLVNEVVGGEYYDRAVQIARNFPSVPFPKGWKANIAGTDLNLNYPANWEKAKQIKYSLGYTIPAPRDFVGASALSEPESRAMYNFTNSHDLHLTIAYHTQGEVIYWKYLDYEPERSLEIAKVFSYVSGYPYEETPFFSSFAGYKDWFIQTFDRPGYTIEAGLGESPLPLSQFDTIYKNNIGIMSSAMYLVQK